MSAATFRSQTPEGGLHKTPNLPPLEQASRKLRICVVYGRTPLPMRRADQMTVAHLLAFLHARGHEVDFYFIDTGGAQTKADKEWITAHTRYAQSFAMTKLAALRGLAHTLVRHVPFQVGLFSHPEQRRVVREAVLKNAYDVVYTYYFRSAEITKDLESVVRNGGKKGATFLAFQLSQSLNTRRIAANAPNAALKAFYWLENRLVERYESRIWRHFSRSILIGRRDVEEIKAVCRRLGRPEIDNYIYGAHGTDIDHFQPRHDIPIRANHVVFSGVMRTPTNVQAAQWFVKDVWPLIRAECPAATCSIVGREPTSEVWALDAQPGITVTGTVPDPAVLIAQATVCVNPMQAGGGMQNKLIEFMASSKPVVATSVANEGIGAPQDCLVIADTPAEFARAVLEIFSNPRDAQKMGARARKYVSDNWTWSSHYLKLEQAFYRAVDELNGPSLAG